MERHEVSTTTHERMKQKTLRPRSINDILEATKQGGLSLSQTKLSITLASFTDTQSTTFSPNTSIHQLGIDSIGAIQLASTLRKLENIHITAAELLQQPSIRDIAALVDHKRGLKLQGTGFNLEAFHLAHVEIASTKLQRPIADIERVWPCTAVQMGMISQFLRTGYLYVNHISFALGDHSLTRIVQAWHQICEDEPILRTGFIALEDDTSSPFAMIVHRVVSESSRVRTVSSGDQFRLEKWRKDCTLHFHKDLSNPPWSVVLEQTVHGISMHLSAFHGIYDATSLDLILLRLYRYLENRHPEQMTPIEPVLSEILTSSRLPSDNIASAHSAYWKLMLNDAASNSFPDLTPLRISTRNMQTVSKDTDRSIEELENVCMRRGHTFQSAAQIAWARLLATYLGEDNTVFGVVLSGRDSILGADSVVFPCLVTVPFSVSLSGKTNEDLMDVAMDFNSSVRNHQFCRMSDIQRWAGREILLDTLFAYQKMSSRETPVPWKVLDETSAAEVGTYDYP